MPFTSQQNLLIKAAILADPTLASQPSDGDGLNFIADALNAVASPDYFVWRKSLSRHEILTGTSELSTTFSWAGGSYITRSQGERDAFREMFNSTGTVDPSLASIKAAFADIFSGTGGAGNRTHIDAMSKRRALRIEKILATGNGAFSTPSTLGYEGTISPNEVDAARRS